MIDVNQPVRIYRHSFYPGRISKPFVSHRFKVAWIRKGWGDWNMGGQVEAVGPQDIVLLKNGEKRHFARIDDQAGLELLALELEPRFLYDTALLHLFTGPENTTRVLHADSHLAGLLAQVDREDSDPDGYSRVVVAACAAQILAAIARRLGLPAGPRPVIPPMMTAVLSHIDEHYGRRITLDELAAIAHMSPTAFSKAFTKTNGIGPAQYIKRRRIGQAIRLLEETDRTVIDIALDCGFTNISNFYKAFHSLTGQAPGDYRGGHV
ncbi:helix-turn-helix transcriptional regulator [Paenibacillus sp. 1P07SE]|uniref:helix-turn-helix transcriptional regulator n=1 Tax=Paenibacillus sp. 1P07SE TaxID=3132209 RepID=UPI0039A5B676